MAKCSDKRVIVAISGSDIKTSLSFHDEFFPSGTPKCMLQIGDAFKVSVTKDFSENGIVGNT